MAWKDNDADRMDTQRTGNVNITFILRDILYLHDFIIYIISTDMDTTGPQWTQSGMNREEPEAAALDVINKGARWDWNKMAAILQTIY